MASKDESTQWQILKITGKGVRARSSTESMSPHTHQQGMFCHEPITRKKNMNLESPSKSFAWLCDAVFFFPYPLPMVQSSGLIPRTAPFFRANVGTGPGRGDTRSLGMGIWYLFILFSIALLKACHRTKPTKCFMQAILSLWSCQAFFLLGLLSNHPHLVALKASEKKQSKMAVNSQQA